MNSEAQRDFVSLLFLKKSFDQQLNPFDQQLKLLFLSVHKTTIC